MLKILKPSYNTWKVKKMLIFLYLGFIGLNENVCCVDMDF